MIKKIILVIVLLISTTNLTVAQKKIQPYHKGDFRVDLKLPHFNHLSFNPNREFRDSEFGFNGYGLGFEYNYKDNKFLEASSSLATTFEIPFPAPVDAEYNKTLYSFYFNLTDNIIRNRFTFGYGLTYTNNMWAEWTEDFTDMDAPINSSKTITNRNLGLTVNSYYRLGRTFHLGLIYQPSLLNFNSTPQFIYEHSISLELNWRIKLFNALKNK